MFRLASNPKSHPQQLPDYANDKLRVSNKGTFDITGITYDSTFLTTHSVIAKNKLVLTLKALDRNGNEPPVIHDSEREVEFAN